ncbi:MAG: PaaI family thioesterase [Clostridiales bacterium]|nr:PaaI family thioesterase [Clostridiales bacterium]
MSQDYMEQIRINFRNDRFATENGMVIDDAADGYAQCSMQIEPHHRNANDQVMGGAIYTLADFAFAVASNGLESRYVSRSAQITYLGIVKGETLIARARRVKDGRTACYYLVEITDERGSQVAHITVNGSAKPDYSRNR